MADLRAYRGVARDLVIAIDDGAATPTPINVTNWTGAFHLRTNVIEDEPLVTLTEADPELKIGTVTATSVVVELSGEHLDQTPGWYVFDLDLVDQDDKPFTVIKGFLEILDHP